MTRRMYRYEFDMNHRINEITLDAGATIRAFECPADAGSRAATFWAEVTDGAVTSARTFMVVPTGDPIPNAANRWQWRATSARNTDGEVFHLYERTGPVRVAPIPEPDAG